MTTKTTLIHFSEETAVSESVTISCPKCKIPVISYQEHVISSIEYLTSKRYLTKSCLKGDDKVPKKICECPDTRHSAMRCLEKNSGFSGFFNYILSEDTTHKKRCAQNAIDAKNRKTN